MQQIIDKDSLIKNTTQIRLGTKIFLLMIEIIIENEGASQILFLRIWYGGALLFQCEKSYGFGVRGCFWDSLGQYLGFLIE